MKNLMIVVGVMLFTSATMANSQFQVRTVDTKTCKVTKNTNGFNVRTCPNVLTSNDYVVIHGSSQRSELVVSNDALGNDPYYMAMGRADANYNVSGPLHIVDGKNWLGKMVPKAIIYRLDYTHYNGQKGYQIVTVRIGDSKIEQRKRDQTCIVSSFDVDSATTFATIDRETREQAMRQAAVNAVAKKDFQSRSCMNYDHGQEQKGMPLPDDHVSFDEGDSQETTHP